MRDTLIPALADKAWQGVQVAEPPAAQPPLQRCSLFSLPQLLPLLYSPPTYASSRNRANPARHHQLRPRSPGSTAEHTIDPAAADGFISPQGDRGRGGGGGGGREDVLRGMPHHHHAHVAQRADGAEVTLQRVRDPVQEEEEARARSRQQAATTAAAATATTASTRSRRGNKCSKRQQQQQQQK